MNFEDSEISRADRTEDVMMLKIGLRRLLLFHLILAGANIFAKRLGDTVPH